MVVNEQGQDRDSAGQRAAMRPAPGDDATPGTPGTGEDICRECNGSGRVGNRPCPNCGGTGKVIEGIGGA
jgi:RecJ-like exonuclease